MWVSWFGLGWRVGNVQHDVPGVGIVQALMDGAVRAQSFDPIDGNARLVG